MAVGLFFKPRLGTIDKDKRLSKFIRVLKKFLHISVFLLISAAAFSQAANAIVGLWINETHDQVVEIYQKNGLYFGRIHWLKQPTTAGQPIRDVYNENPDLRNRTLVGVDILSNFMFDSSSNKWRSGNIYNVSNGNTYNGRLSINDEGKLEIHGYWWFLSFLGKTHTWARYK